MVKVAPSFWNCKGERFEAGTEQTVNIEFDPKCKRLWSSILFDDLFEACSQKINGPLQFRAPMPVGVHATWA